jgi:hypothetical protein
MIARATDFLTLPGRRKIRKRQPYSHFFHLKNT